MADLETEYYNRVTSVDPPPADAQEAAENLAAAINNADVVVQGFAVHGTTAVTSAESITGADPQSQIDSIVDALVAYGLVTDDR